VHLLKVSRVACLRESLLQPLRNAIREGERSDFLSELRRSLREKDFCVLYRSVQIAQETKVSHGDVTAGEIAIQQLFKIPLEAKLDAHTPFGTPEWQRSPRWLVMARETHAKLYVVASRRHFDTLETHIVQNQLSFKRSLLPGPIVLASGVDQAEADFEGFVFVTLSSQLEEHGDTDVMLLSEKPIRAFSLTDTFGFQEVIEGEWSIKSCGLPRYGASAPPNSWHRNPQYVFELEETSDEATVAACILGSSVDDSPTCVHFVRNVKQIFQPRIDVDSRNHEVLAYSDYAREAVTLLENNTKMSRMFLVPSMKEPQNQRFRLFVLSTHKFRIHLVEARLRTPSAK